MKLVCSLISLIKLILGVNESLVRFYLLKRVGCADRAPGPDTAASASSASCPSGTTCEFFLTCWMSSGLIKGGCGGFLFACCRRGGGGGGDDTSGIPQHQQRQHHASATSDKRDLTTRDYGPVVNDPSK